MAYQAGTADAAPDAEDFDWSAAEDELSATSYDRIPWIPRRWLWPGYIPVGSPVIFAAAGETGKGLLLCAVAARVVLGLPFPDEDQELRRAPQRVLWISGPGEDDQFEDMAPRLRAAIAHAVAEFGLDDDLAGEHGAITLVHDLSEWRDGTPVTLPADCDRIAAELADIPERKGGPDVALVVADSLSALLSDGFTIDSRQGARRTMGRLSRFTRRAGVACAIIHHLTKDGKVAGSPAVLDAVRIAFTVERPKDDPEGPRTIVRHKANVSRAVPQRYLIRDDEPMTHAEFTDAEDARDQRTRAARPADAPAAPRGGLHERIAEAGGPVTWRVMRREQDPYGREVGDSRLPIVRDLSSADIARSAAFNDAGQVLCWTASGQGREVARVRLADGSTVSYAVYPVIS